MHLALARVNHHRLVEHGQDGSRWRDALDGPGRTPARGLGARVRHGESERANQEGAHGEVSALIHVSLSKFRFWNKPAESES